MTNDSGSHAVRELAISGGSPAFSEHQYVGRPNLPRRHTLHDALDEIFDRQWLTNAGPMVNRFEERLADMLGVEHCIAMTNGTVALEIAIRAAGLTGEVIVPSFTFIATAHALQWQEVTPVFCDIEPTTHSIDPARIESLITPRTTGIVGVHLWGNPCDVTAIQEIADRHGLRVIYDAAHAFSNTHQQRPIGGFGDAEVFSFHATKFFNTLEGGAVTTDDADLAERVRLMKNFGFTYYDQVEHVGTNGKMNEMSAAVGLAGLDSLDDVIARNRANYLAYRDNLADIPGVRLFELDENERNNHQYVVIEVDRERIGLTRDEILVALHAENVIARRYFYPGCHRMEPYRSYFPNAGLLLPWTTEIAEKVLCLPTGTSISLESVGTICAVIGDIVDQADALQRLDIDTDAMQVPQYGALKLEGIRLQ
ncbi:MAG: aminotransferase class I/II-fold pyridoxal phosphate-dependent enzyme [Acidimicrobiia bacterium]|nr:aminotransferase class I/II-fold pyridoxal phosphate-dependent enzyme [Acidimicrobiia bacterium]